MRFAVSMMSPIKDLIKGWRSFFTGVNWLKKHPFYFLLLVFPMALGLALLSVGAGFFLEYQEQMMAWALS